MDVAIRILMMQVLHMSRRKSLWLAMQSNAERVLPPALSYSGFAAV